MSPIAFFDADARDRLVWMVESSLQVRTHSAFFLWTQGALQSLVPHEILICGVSGGLGRPLQMHWLASTRYFRQEHFHAVCQPRTGLVSQVISRWSVEGRPQFVTPDRADATVERALLESELKNIAAHGLRSADGETAGFFSFSRTTLKESPAAARVLDVVVPYVHSTICRVLAEEARGLPSTPRAEGVVTQREVEILRLIREGRTTADIAEALKLSPFTVKNHVQNIFKKLGARSRSHAVAQAIGQGILQNGS